MKTMSKIFFKQATAKGQIENAGYTNGVPNWGIHYGNPKNCFIKVI